MHILVILLRGAGFALAALLGTATASACTVSASVTSNLGTYSPAAVKAAVVPALQSRAGITCPVAVLTLLSNNSLKAKFKSANVFKLLQQGGSASIAYTASADAAGTTPYAQNSTVDYMQNNLLNLLGLLGGSSADLPLFVKPGAVAVTPPAGAYSDRITIDWSWYMCPGIGLLGACIGTVNEGTGQSIIDVTLLVSPQNVIMTMSTTTTWGPMNGIVFPKAIPGSRQRATAAVANPDIVPLESGTVAIVLPTPAGMIVALDGDGVNLGDVIRLTEGSPASGVTMRYGGGTDGTDDVDFSTDGGTSWTAAPSVASQGAVTHVRIRPQKAMAKQSAFSVSLPYLVK